MIFSKIDKTLLSSAGLLDSTKKWNCIVKANDYTRLKRILLHNKIEILDEYLFIKSFFVNITKMQMEALSNMSQVKYISSVSSASMMINISKKILGLDNTNLSGKGQTVAIIDTGISLHPDFCLQEKRIVLFKDFIEEKERPYDDNGHGTFVAGVCAGNGAMSGGKYNGIAPQSKIISLKALNKKGEASADRILSAMEWVFDNHKIYGIKVVCMSFGSDPLGYNDPIMMGAEALWREGITVVAAAGNSGPEYQTIKSPGVSSQIITVGGFDDNRFDDGKFNENFFELAKFSSRGPAFQRYKPDLVAPGVDIISCGLKEYYTKLSGTSVATPMIAGIALLLLERNPNLKPNEIKRKILSSCRPISFNKNYEGYGYPILSRII